MKISYFLIFSSIKIAPLIFFQIYLNLLKKINLKLKLECFVSYIMYMYIFEMCNLQI